MYIDTNASTRVIVNAGHADTATTLNSLRPTLSIGNESNAITIQTMDNAEIADLVGHLGSIRTGIDFPWYQTHWRIGNIRGGSTDSAGFGFAYSADGTTWTSCSYIGTDGTYMGLANQAACIKDAGDGRALYFNYSANAMTSCSWLAAWNGNTLQSIAPSSLSVNYANSAGSVAWGNITGKPSSFSPASHTHNNIISSGTITMITGTAKHPDGFTVGNIYNSEYPFPYGSTWRYQGQFGAELIFNGLGGDAGVGTGHMYFRTRSDWVTSTWGDWKHLLDSSNYTSYTVTKIGEGASGTWGINVTGSAGSVAWANITGKPSTFAPSSHTHSYLPLSGGTLSGRLTINTSLQDHSMPIEQCLVINSTGLTDTVTAATDANSPGIGIHIGNVTWGSLILNGAGWKFCNSGFTGYMPVYASTFYGDLSGNATSATRATQDGNGATISSTYLKLSGGTMTGALNLANGAWNKAGDDAQFGDNNTAGSFAIQGLNGNTNLKMVTYGGTTYGTITWSNNFYFSNTINFSNMSGQWAANPSYSSAFINFGHRSHDALSSGIYYTPWFGGMDSVNSKGYGATMTLGLYHGSDPANAGLYIGGSWDGNTNDTFYYFSRSGTFTATQVYGAVWNDYAEYRETTTEIEPGRVVIENGNDTLSLCQERLMATAQVVSDTFGFAIGETDNCKTPLAVSGRVLVYTDMPRETFQAGDTVCSGINGTVSKMTREEIMMYPERIIGVVSAIPEYETWGTGNVKVNGRIWIKLT